MKDLILMIVAFIIVAAFVGHMEINLSPFSIKLPMWHRVVCMILLVITYILWNFGEYASLLRICFDIDSICVKVFDSGYDLYEAETIKFTHDQLSELMP